MGYEETYQGVDIRWRDRPAVGQVSVEVGCDYWIDAEENRTMGVSRSLMSAMEMRGVGGGWWQNETERTRRD